MVFLLVYILVEIPTFFYFTAILSTIMVLSIKVVALAVQGPQLKKLSTRMTSTESQYESSLQLFLVLAIIILTGTITWMRWMSLLSSFLMIGKSGAESYLTFGRANLIEQTGSGWRGLLKKLKLLAIFSAVFVLTTVARLTALAVVLAFESNGEGDSSCLVCPMISGKLFFLPLSLAGPTALLLLVKPCGFLKDLSVVDLVKAVLGEQTTHFLWGGRGREGSRKLQLFMQIYLLLLHSSFMVMSLLSIGWVDWKIEPEAVQKLGERLKRGAFVSLSTGWFPRVVLTTL